MEVIRYLFSAEGRRWIRVGVALAKVIAAQIQDPSKIRAFQDEIIAGAEDGTLLHGELIGAVNRLGLPRGN